MWRGFGEVIRLPSELLISLINRRRCTGSNGAVYQLRRVPKKEIMCFGGWVKGRRRENIQQSLQKGFQLVK